MAPWCLNFHSNRVGNRRLHYSAPMLYFLLAFLGCTGNSSPTPQQPDVVLVIVDTLRADTLSFAGHSRSNSPNLDALSKESAWFSKAYATSSWTLPSTASILTGLLPHEHRVVRDGVKHHLFGRLDLQHQTLAEVYQARGYRTGAFINNSFLAKEFRLNQGFEVYDYQGAGQTKHRSAETTVQQALQWLDTDRKKPAFLLVHIMEPHTDYTAPPPFAGRFTAESQSKLSAPIGPLVGQLMNRQVELPEVDRDFIRKAYDEEILTADNAVGALIQGLKERERYAKSTLVVTSDHGEEFWEYGGYEHGHTTKSAVTQVPLLVRMPGAKQGENTSIVSLVDLYAALTENKGPIAELAQSGANETTGIAISEDRLYGPLEISVVSQDFRFIFWPAQNKQALFELDENGHEVRNVIQDEALREKAKSLPNHLLQKRKSLAPIKASDPIAVRDFSDFEKLKELGYVD